MRFNYIKVGEKSSFVLTVACDFDYARLINARNTVYFSAANHFERAFHGRINRESVLPPYKCLCICIYNR